jgi:hypothetical protein
VRIDTIVEFGKSNDLESLSPFKDSLSSLHPQLDSQAAFGSEASLLGNAGKWHSMGSSFDGAIDQNFTNVTSGEQGLNLQLPSIKDSSVTVGDPLTGVVGINPLLGNQGDKLLWGGSNNTNSSIVFIDSSVQDYQSLIAGIKLGTEVAVLDSVRNQVEQIGEYLAGRSNISSLHIVSHGNSGSLQLGGTKFGIDSLNNNSNALQSWSKSLTADADILLYGCDVAEGDQGAAFVKQISRLTGADVAASNDLTGNAALGGDWDLEATTGKIEASLAFESSTLEAYRSILFNNRSFESGDFSGWQTIGDSSIKTASFGISPTQGTYQALMTSGSGSVTDATLESFLGLANGTLDSLAGGNATEGSAIKQTLTVSAGDQLSFNWNFLNGEAVNSSFKDFAFVSITSNSSSKLADTFNSFVTAATSSPSFNLQTGFQTFSYIFPNAGDFTVGLGALDFNDTAVDSGLLVDAINNAPTVTNRIGDQTATEDSLYNFQVAANTFSDVDAEDTLTYTATSADGTALPSWLTFDAATSTFSGTPTNGDVGSLNVDVVATDSTNTTATDSFTLSVNNINDAPTVVNSIGEQNATEDSPFNFQVANTFSDVDPGDTLTYTATLADGTALPSWLTVDVATGTINGTPTNGDVGLLNVNVTATDLYQVGLNTHSIMDITILHLRLASCPNGLLLPRI